MNKLIQNKQHGFLIKLNETNLMAMVNKNLQAMKKDFEDKFFDTEVYCMGVEVETISINKKSAIEQLQIRFPVFIAKNKVVMQMVDMSIDLELNHCKECNPNIKQSMIHIESFDDLISTALEDNQIAVLFTEVAFEQ